MVIHPQFIEIESHNSIVKGERYHYPLRRIFEVKRSTYNKLSNKTILRMSIKTINGTIGPNELVPSLLVFVTLTTLSCTSKINLNQTERLEALKLRRT